MAIQVNYQVLVLLALCSICGFTLYSFILVIYRLYLHPLARFPGPKLAAATLWYEFYFDVVKPGSYIWKIKELHEEYGPIIRISPNAIHVNDPDFYDVYSGKVGEKRNKYKWAVTHFNSPEAMLSTVDHAHHRLRRAPVAPFFSKANVRKLDYILHDELKKFRLRLQQFEKTGEPLNILDGFKALTGDIITTYAFGQNNNYLDVPDFNKPFWQLFHKLSAQGWMMNHYDWILPTMRSLPPWVHERMGMEYILTWEKKSKAQLNTIITNKNLGEKENPTVFSEVLSSDLPPEEKAVDRLWHDAQTFNIAGSETTAWALGVMTYYLLTKPAILHRLQKELNTIIQDGLVENTCTTELEKLPYLTAVIKEGLRMSFGVAGRLYRISPDKPLVFKNGFEEWVIPQGTPVAMTIPLIHLNPAIFPAPTEFQPERWLSNPQLDRYLCSFSKGPRACVGMNLAWAELYNTVATLFGHYGEGNGGGPMMKLWNTTEKDVQTDHDFFVPSPYEGSKGVRVVVSA